MEKRDEVESPGTEQEQEQQEEHPACSMQLSNLNDDCLIHIFQQLGFSDRLRLERVCKRWQAVLEESWYDLKTLSYTDYKGWGLEEEGDLGYIGTRDLEKVLKRCGTYIRKIDLYEGEEDEDLDPNILSTITQHCLNIEHVRVMCFHLTPASLRILAEGCSRITELSLESFMDNCDEELALIFRRNDKLRSLHLNENPKFTGECFAALNADKIEAISIEACRNVKMQHLSVLQNFNNLENLELYCFLNTINTEEAEIISECFPTLKELHIHCYPGFPFSANMIAKLSNVEVLAAAENSLITDDLLVAVGNNCRSLKELNINFCTLVTNRGLAAILALPNLETLAVNSMSLIDDTVFDCAPKLTKLYCGWCVNMRDTGFARLIKNSHRIEEIYLPGCPKISNALIKDAIIYTKERDNNVVLKLMVHKNSVNLDEITDSSPLLQVELW